MYTSLKASFATVLHVLVSQYSCIIYIMYQFFIDSLNCIYSIFYGKIENKCKITNADIKFSSEHNNSARKYWTIFKCSNRNPTTDSSCRRWILILFCINISISVVFSCSIFIFSSFSCYKFSRNQLVESKINKCSYYINSKQATHLELLRL